MRLDCRTALGAGPFLRCLVELPEDLRVASYGRRHSAACMPARAAPRSLRLARSIRATSSAEIS